MLEVDRPADMKAYIGKPVGISECSSSHFDFA
jgi:hypothetical protein